MLNACDSTEMCEVASSSGSQSMALAEVGCCACGSSHCFSLTLPQIHNTLGLVSGLDGRSPILLYLILYHILVVLCVPWIINIEPPFTTTKLGGYMFQVQTLCLYPVCLLACKGLTLWFNRAVATVVCEKSNTWFLSFQKKNMIGCAFVAEAWSICDVHCLTSSSRANVWECVQAVGKLEITVSNTTTRHDLLLSNMAFIFIWDSLVLLSPLIFVLMRNIYSHKWWRTMPP